jgi:hypothetical protein
MHARIRRRAQRDRIFPCSPPVVRSPTRPRRQGSTRKRATEWVFQGVRVARFRACSAATTRTRKPARATDFGELTLVTPRALARAIRIPDAHIFAECWGIFFPPSATLGYQQNRGGARLPIVAETVRVDDAAQVYKTLTRCTICISSIRRRWLRPEFEAERRHVFALLTASSFRTRRGPGGIISCSTSFTMQCSFRACSHSRPGWSWLLRICLCDRNFWRPPIFPLP